MLTVAAELSGLAVPRDKLLKIGVHAGAAGHVLLAYKKAADASTAGPGGAAGAAAGRLLASCGHWVELCHAGGPTRARLLPALKGGMRTLGRAEQTRCLRRRVDSHYHCRNRRRRRTSVADRPRGAGFSVRAGAVLADLCHQLRATAIMHIVLATPGQSERWVVRKSGLYNGPN